MKIKSTFMAPILVVAVILLMAVCGFAPLDALSYQDNICLAIVVIQLISLVVPGALYTKLKGEGFIGRLRFRLMGIEKLLVTLLSALTVILGDVLLKLVLFNIGFVDSGYSVYGRFLGSAEPGVLYTLITFALVPAVCEELLFRGILCAEYESGGVLTAVVASSLLYAMFGMDFGYFPIFFFTGVMFAHIMYLTRSVFAAMLCHFIYCVFDLAAGDTVRTIITKPQSIGFLVFAVAGLFLLCLAALFGESERIYYGYAMSGIKPEHTAGAAGSKGRAFAEALLAPPLWVAAVLFIVAAITL